MKKNGKKYRKIQKEKELKRQANIFNYIDQEVDGIKTANLSMAHIVIRNPVIFENENMKKEYLSRLSKYLKIGGWNKRKYESSEIEAYKKIILECNEVKSDNSISYYKYFIMFDLIHILGYEIEKIPRTKLDAVKKEYLNDFSDADASVFMKIINSVQGEDSRLVNLIKNDALANEREYIELVRQNLQFKKELPFGIMVTATMSAGKSTFINSILGKYICLSQNMACTSKIHTIINKPFEDGYATEYDHDLVMTAGREELLIDNEMNTSDKIFVSTHYNGGLSDGRFIINDSPGVNFSGDSEHKEIADRLIKGRKYNLLIYVMNSTQLATNDEDEHLDYVKHTIGRTPIIFVMNKVDSYDVEEENIVGTIQRQVEYLKKKGFKNPVICPISARAGFLAKQFSSGKVSRSEERELYNYVDKFEQMNLNEYYKNRFPTIEIEDSDKEETQLLKNCGIAYVEEIIKGYAKGGR